MLDQLRGRNLSHVGCTIGLVAGLVVGMIAGIIIISLFHSSSAADWAALAWIGLTLALGVLGFIAGGSASQRMWGNSKTTRD